jgi:hypothetical protein
MQALLRDEEKQNPFVPIRIVQNAGGEDVVPQMSRQESKGESRSEIEIALPGGAVIRLNDNCNLRMVAELLSILKR